MKLSELCEVMNYPVNVYYKDENKEKVSFYLNGESFQQKIHQCGEYAHWNVVGISRENGCCAFIEVEIVKPEEEE